MSRTKATQEPSTSNKVFSSPDETPSPPDPKSDRSVESLTSASAETSGNFFEIKNGNLSLSLHISLSFPTSDT